MEKKKVEAINLIRIISMIMILLFHARLLYGFRIGIEPVDDLFSIGAVCVTVFFILSGFGLRKRNRELVVFEKTAVSNENLRIINRLHLNTTALQNYLVRRLLSIYPLYLLLQVVAVVFSFRVDGFWENGVWLIPVQLTMTQVLVGSDMYQYLFNDNCWYISALFILYLLFPLLNESIRLLNRHIKQWNRNARIWLFICLIVGLCVLSEGIYLYQVFGVDGNQFLDYYPNPLFRIPEFYVGMLVADLSEDLTWTQGSLLSVTAFVSCLALTTIGLLVLYPHFGLEYNLYNILVIPCTVICILCIAESEPLNRYGGSNVARWLAEMGLEMYLCQSFAILFMERVETSSHHGLWFIALSVMIAVVVHLVFTKNVQKLFRKRDGR